MFPFTTTIRSLQYSVTKRKATVTGAINNVKTLTIPAIIKAEGDHTRSRRSHLAP
ncbi:MAG: hypothetical protein IIZ39_07525 [Blautia sp.]|nr:hypothetical protein [Blautia sp.]